MAATNVYPWSIRLGGTGKAERSQAFTNLAPQEPLDGDTIVWDAELEEWVSSENLTGVIEDLITVQQELADELSEQKEISRQTLSELRKIKLGISLMLGGKQLSEFE